MKIFAKQEKNMWKISIHCQMFDQYNVNEYWAHYNVFPKLLSLLTKFPSCSIMPEGKGKGSYNLWTPWLFLAFMVTFISSWCVLIMTCTSWKSEKDLIGYRALSWKFHSMVMFVSKWCMLIIACCSLFTE